MKFLHLSDLHIGKSVNGFSMLAEQRRAFEQIIALVRAERPAAAVIAGDVYDRAVPGVEAVRAFDDFLTELAREDIAVLLISGNHDSPERLGYASRLLSDRRLHICGAFDGAARKVALADEHGDVNFWLLPHIKPLTVRGALAERELARERERGGEAGRERMDERERAVERDRERERGGEAGIGSEAGSGAGSESGREIESYGDALAAALEASAIDYSARNVLVSHQFYTWAGAEAPVRSESEISPVGGLDAIDAAPIERFDYVALGHLHRAQAIGREHIRYAGSPIKYSFSEWRHEKSATLVELGAKGSLSVSAVPLVPLRDMREIRGSLAELIAAGTGRGDGQGQGRKEQGAGQDQGQSDGRQSQGAGQGEGEGQDQGQSDGQGENRQDQRPGRGDGGGAPQASREDYLRVILTDEDEIVDPMGKLRSVYPNIMSLGFENSRTGTDIYAAAAAADAGEIERLSPYDLFSEFFLEAQGSTMSAEQAGIVRELLDEGGEE